MDARLKGKSLLISTNAWPGPTTRDVLGKALKADLAGVWRYWVGDYRILCEIQDRDLIVLVVAVGHRKEIYR